MHWCRSTPALTAVACLVSLARGLPAQEHAGPANVVVVANAGVPESLAVAERYRLSRGLAPEQVCALEAPAGYSVTLAEFQALVRQPLAACLEGRGLRQQALFLAVAWGIPGVISDGGEAVLGKGLRAVDSFLHDAFEELEPGVNPYYHSGLAFTRANGFTGYLVTRLDGPSSADSWTVPRG